MIPLMLTGLNDKQQQAVLAAQGPVLIIAGAGSGKTQVLTRKIAYLIHEKLAYPSQIFAVTFTNKAAKEMKARVQRYLDNVVSPSELNSMWLNTFHAACVRILRAESDKLGIPNNFIIYDSADQLSVVKKMLKELDIDDKQFKPNAILGAISSAKNELISPESYSGMSYDIFAKKVALVYPRYQKELRAKNALDFDDLLFYTVDLFKNHPDVLKKYQDKFKYILVDEYQDTNVSQYYIIRMLAQKHHNICVVGDGDQNIYSWRGANAQNIRNFERDFPGAAVVMLEQNYRSTPNILSAANDVIVNNPDRKDKKLWTDKPEGEKVLHYHALNEREEAGYIAEEILKLTTDDGFSLKDVVVLYRTNAQSRVIEDVFMARNIKYQIIGAYKFFDRKEIKDLLAFLRVLYNPADSYSLIRALGCVARGVGPASIAKLEVYAEAHGLTLFESLGANDVLKGKAGTTAADFFRVMMELRIILQAKPLLFEFIEQVVEKTGFMSSLSGDNDKEKEDRIENVLEFIGVAKEREGETLDEFLQSVALVADIDEAQDQLDAVTLMTLHSAKGLEFPVVFMVGMEEGLLPHFRTLFAPEEVEEERRLCYVGMTRAMQKLYLTSVITRTIFGNTSANELSRFVKEISKENLHSQTTNKLSIVDKKYNFIAASGVTFSAKADNDKYKQKSSDVVAFTIGDVVAHPKFGTGKVVYAIGSGIDTTVTVRFKDEERTLMLKYAPLQKI